MFTVNLARRKDQLAVLRDACAVRTRARLAAVAPTTDDGVTTSCRLVGLGPDGVEVDVATPNAALTRATMVEVRFDHAGEPLVFRATPRCDELEGRAQADIGSVFRLTLPTTIGRRERRTHPRYRLREVGAVPVQFTNVNRSREAFLAALTNISPRGLGGRAPATAGALARRGGVYWANFTLPDEPHPFEFVVRLVHTHVINRSGVLVLGCALCPGDEPVTHQAQVERIGRYVGQRMRRRRQADDATHAGGE